MLKLSVFFCKRIESLGKGSLKGELVFLYQGFEAPKTELGFPEIGFEAPFAIDIRQV